MDLLSSQGPFVVRLLRPRIPLSSGVLTDSSLVFPGGAFFVSPLFWLPSCFLEGKEALFPPKEQNRPFPLVWKDELSPSRFFVFPHSSIRSRPPLEPVSSFSDGLAGGVLRFFFLLFLRERRLLPGNRLALLLPDRRNGPPPLDFFLLPRTHTVKLCPFATLPFFPP